VYFDDSGCPACIVGHVFAAVGADMGSVHEQGWTPEVTDMGNGLAVEAVYVDGVAMTDGAVAVFREAQRVQDRGAPWGDALAKAVERAEDAARDGVL
jgi:hypothetical protein